jgi:hypothetical protein
MSHPLQVVVGVVALGALSWLNYQGGRRAGYTAGYREGFRQCFFVSAPFVVLPATDENIEVWHKKLARVCEADMLNSGNNPADISYTPPE